MKDNNCKNCENCKCGREKKGEEEKVIITANGSGIITELDSAKVEAAEKWGGKDVFAEPGD